MTTLETTTLRDRMAGQVVTPGDAGYDEARAIYNGMIDRRPAVIARCRSVADVQAALDIGRRSGLPIAVRGGGHNGPGFGTVEGGLVIDLSEMNAVDVDPAARTVRVQGGATWDRVDAATHEHGLATAVRDLLHHRGRRPDAGRRARLPVAQVRADHRQPARGRGRAGRRAGGDRVGDRASRPVLGAARRRGQLRHRDVVRVPLPPGHERGRRPDPVAGGGHRRGAELVPGLPAGPERGPLRLLRHDDGPARRPLSGRAAQLGRRAGSCGATRAIPPMPTPRSRRSASRRRSGRASGPSRIPRLQSAFDPLYPKGLQWYWRGDFVRTDPGRGSRRTRTVRRAAAVAALDHAPLPDRRRGAARRRGGHRVGPPRRHVVPGDRRHRPGPAQRRGDLPLDRRLLDRAAPVLGGRCLRELHDGRGPGPGAGHLRRQLRPASRGQGGLRPAERPADQPEPPAGDLRLPGWLRGDVARAGGPLSLRPGRGPGQPHGAGAPARRRARRAARRVDAAEPVHRLVGARRRPARRADERGDGRCRRGRPGR